MQANAGFLIVRSFEFLYSRFALTLGNKAPFYAIPRLDRPSDHLARRYRGLDRNPLGGWPVSKLGVELHDLASEEPEAHQAMYDLEEAGGVEAELVLSPSGVQRVFALLRKPEDWDVIWSACPQTEGDRMGVGSTLGYEPTWFPSGHFSALCDCMCFPRWHGTDREGTLFADHFARLNEHALFSTDSEASDFLRFYLSQDWTETGDYTITEICRPAFSV
jgi:hypothetical protein